MKVEWEDRDPRFAAIAGGFIKVGDNKVTVVTTACEWEDEIDLHRAELAAEHAKEMRAHSTSQQEMDRAEVKLKRALNRISVAKH
jgi:F-type H+-transporting ATPase subunit epsilon